MNPGLCLRVRHQHSQFWPILTRFVDYYSPFWTPEVISIVVEPQGVLTCWSSTLVVLGRFGPVSWTITHRFGVPKHFPLLLNPKACLRVGHQDQEFLANSGPFHGLLLTVFRFQSDFHGCRTPRCAYVSVINNHSLGRFWPVSWTITQF